MSSGVQNVSPENNLVFFLQDRLEPALRNAARIDSSGSLNSVYSNLDLLESYLWLHLGVAVGYFPQPLSRRAMYEYSVPIFKAYGAILETNRIETWFPQPLRVILDEEFNGRAALLTVPERPIAVQILTLSKTFQNVFLLANEFAQLGEAARLVSAISLSTDSMWKNATVEEESGEFPLDSERHIRLPDDGVSWSNVGFFQMIEYMKTVPHLHEDSVSTFEERAKNHKPTPSPGMISDERYRLERFFEELREVQQWRFNFGYPTPRERFLQAAQNVAESLMQFTYFAESPEEAVRGFQKEVSELLHYWGAPRRKGAGA